MRKAACGRRPQAIRYGGDLNPMDSIATHLIIDAARNDEPLASGIGIIEAETGGEIDVGSKKYVVVDSRTRTKQKGAISLKTQFVYVARTERN